MPDSAHAFRRARRQPAAPGQIVVADSTRRLAGQSFEIESLGSQELKGFNSRIALFAVRGEREVESRFDAAHPSALSKFVGRTSEIGMLLERWEQRGHSPVSRALSMLCPASTSNG